MDETNVNVLLEFQIAAFLDGTNRGKPNVEAEL
jgi:hypothetical protein